MSTKAFAYTCIYIHIYIYMYIYNFMRIKLKAMRVWTIIIASALTDVEQAAGM